MSSRMNHVRRKWMKDRLYQDAEDLRKFRMGDLATQLEEAADLIYEMKAVEIGKEA